MARSKPQPIEMNSFTGGIVTEASPLTFPANASLDEQNMLLNRDGSRQRRKGVATLDGYDNPILRAAGNFTSADDIDILHWDLESNSTAEAAYVIRKGSVSSYREEDDGTVGAVIPITNPPVFPSTGPHKSFTSKGNLFVWGASIAGQFPGIPIDYFKQGFYRAAVAPSSATLSLQDEESVSVKVRDVWGVTTPKFPDVDVFFTGGLAPGDRWNSVQSPITKEERARWYGLSNSGWSLDCIVTHNSGDDYETRFKVSAAWDVGQRAKWDYVGASPARIWPSILDPYASHVGDSVIVTDPSFVGGGDVAVSAFDYLSFARGNSDIRVFPAMGKFIIDPFRRDITRATEFHLRWATASASSFPLVDYTPVSPPNNNVLFYRDADTVEFLDGTQFAGRAFTCYSRTGEPELETNWEYNDTENGARPLLDDMVFYGKVVTDAARSLECHADNDPTAVEFNDTLDTDGGFINIPGSGGIHKLSVMGESLFVFAKNGVWQISGEEGTFSATQQNVNKVTHIGTVSRKSVIAASNSIYYFGDGGIYVVKSDPVSLKGTATNITDTTIQDIYLGWSQAARDNAEGCYDVVGGSVRWLVAEGSTLPYKDLELVLDDVTGAYTLQRFSNVGEVEMPDGYTRQAPMPIKYHSTRYRIDGGPGERSSSVQYLSATYVQGLHVTDLYLLGRSDTSFTDLKEWGGGSDAEAYLLTGYLTGGDSQRDKQASYITCSFKRTEDGFTGSEEEGWEATSPSSCKLQTQWEWTDSPLAGKWGREQQVYRHKRLYIPEDPATDDWSGYGYPVINTRSKVRGQGKALSLLFTSEPEKEMHIYGWATNFSLNEDV